MKTLKFDEFLPSPMTFLVKSNRDPLIHATNLIKLYKNLTRSGEISIEYVKIFVITSPLSIVTRTIWIWPSLNENLICSIQPPLLVDGGLHNPTHRHPYYYVINVVY